MDRIICAPVSLRSSGETALTEPCVPTGMNAGVSKVPWAVVISPVLAPQSLALCFTLNSKFQKNHPSELSRCRAAVAPCGGSMNQHGISITVKPVAV